MHLFIPHTYTILMHFHLVNAESSLFLFLFLSCLCLSFLKAEEGLDVQDILSEDAGTVAEEKRAIVLLRKHIIETEGGNYIVKDLSFTVEYAVYNVGDDVATDITIEDKWPEAVQITAGAFPIIVEELAPGASFLSNVTFKAITVGPFNTDVSAQIYKYIYINMYVCMYVCMPCIFTYIYMLRLYPCARCC
jgi:hypothetical protein